MLNYLGANATEFPGLAADTNSDAHHLQCYGYQAIALYRSGNQQDGLALLADLLDRAHGNADLEAKFGENLASLSRSMDAEAADQLFAWVMQKFPSHPYASFGRLELAIRAFNTGDVAGAMKLANDIINALPEKTKMPWIQKVYWSAVYLRGCCLQAQGQAQQGATLKQLAMSKFPALTIQKRLNS
jgi:tetratricopeptide (TPR) repeat protein